MASASKQQVNEQRAIRNGASVCRDLFLTSLSCYYSENGESDHIIKSQIQDEFGRFNLWTASNDIFAPNLISLDARLVASPVFKGQLLAQLEALKERLEERKSTSILPLTLNEMTQDNKGMMSADQYSCDHSVNKMVSNSLSGLEQLATLDSIYRVEASLPLYIPTIAGQIHTTIDWLRRLTNLITREGFASYGQQANNQQMANESDNEATASESNQFEHMVREECPNIPQYLMHRLVKSMYLRQEYIKSRRSTGHRWTTELEQSQAVYSDIPRIFVDPESGEAVVAGAEQASVSLPAKQSSHATSSLNR